jgi:hypothetical protein
MEQNRAKAAIMGELRPLNLLVPMVQPELTLFCLTMRAKYPFRSRTDAFALIKSWVENRIA